MDRMRIDCGREDKNKQDLEEWVYPTLMTMMFLMLPCGTKLGSINIIINDIIFLSMIDHFMFYVPTFFIVSHIKYTQLIVIPRNWIKD